MLLSGVLAWVLLSFRCFLPGVFQLLEKKLVFWGVGDEREAVREPCRAAGRLCRRVETTAAGFRDKN